MYADRAFALFLAALREHVTSLKLVGRLSPPGGAARYPVGEGVELVALPYYENLAHVRDAGPALLGSLRAFWGSLGTVDCVWLLGPHPLALAFAALALARGKQVRLGVRQDFPAYVRSRHPNRRAMWVAAWLLEVMYRGLAKLVPVVAVGPELAAKYARSKRVLELTVSLIHDDDVIEPDTALQRDYDGALRILAVGRLEEEKNPLLLADVLAELNREDARWSLIICGEGRLQDALEARLDEHGERASAELRGYVPFGEPLTTLYRSSHVLLHTSWTEGMPAVLPEAFAAGLPAVAADVGGISRAVGGAAILVPPGSPEAAATAVRSIAADPALRERLVREAHAFATAHTIETETRRVADFLSAR